MDDESDDICQFGDGAYGTLLAPHLRADEVCDLLNLREPARVLEAHTAYVDAGATWIQTNTFMAWSLAAPKKRDVYRAGIELAGEAAEPVSANVVATIGPAGREPRLYYLDLELLLTAGATRIRCETVTDEQTAAAFARAWEEVSDGADAMATLSLSIASSGSSARWGWLESFDGSETLRLGLNCCEGPQDLRGPLELLAAHSEPLGIELAPSAGLPRLDGDSICHPWQPDAWSEAVAKACEDLPVRVVGGCCGTTPAHIGALASLT